MSGLVSFWIPIEPVAWSRPRFNRRSGAVFNSAKLRTYETALTMHLTRCYSKARPVSGDVILRLKFYLRPPKKKVRERPGIRPDLDNLTKGVKDAANGVLWNDDSQVIRVEAEKLYDWTTRKVGIEITVTEVRGEA